MLDNKKGEISPVGKIILAFFGVIVGITIIIAIAGQTGQMTTTYQLSNHTFTAPSENGTVDLVGQSLLGTAIVTNATGGEVVPTTNYTIKEGVSTTTGVKTVQLTFTRGQYASKSLNVSYLYGAEGYVDDSAGRAIIPLIVLFCGLAVAVFVMWRTGLLEDMKNWF